MAFRFSKTRYSPIAIDFGADSLKLLQLVPGDPPQLVAAAAALVPEEARTDPAARQAFLADALKGLLRSQPFKGRRVMCSLPAFQTLIQNLVVPRTDSDTELALEVGAQLRDRLNVEPTRMVVRSFPVTQVVREGTPMQEVLCLAASRDVVMRYLDLCNRLRLDVVGMHGEPTTILRAFDHLHRGRDEARTLCYIDIGAATTKVVIAHGSQIVFAKTVHAAGDEMTRQLAEDRRIDFTEARAFRIAEAGGDANAPATPAASAAPAPAPSPAAGPTGLAVLDAQHGAPRPAAQPQGQPAGRHAPQPHGADTIECLIDELQLCLRYHQSLFPDRSIEKLIFLGGEARHTRTCQAVARALRVAAQLGDPLARLARIGQRKPAEGVDLDQPQPGWAVPLGLCLSEANL